MAQIMNVQIRVILPDGENLTIPVEDSETFQDFQNRVLQTHDLHLDKDYFNFQNTEVGNEDNLSTFINSYNSSNTDDHSETIIYEIRLQNNLENSILPIKHESDIPNVHDENMECTPNEAFISYKEVQNLEPLLTLNSVSETNGVINVLDDNIFDNVTYEVIDTNTKDDSEVINSVKILESSIAQIVETNNQSLNSIEEPSKTIEDEINTPDDVLITSELTLIDDDNLQKNTNDDRIYNYMDIESKLREIHENTEELVTDLCRLCAKTLTVEDKVLIYGENDTFDEKINNCLPISVGIDDGLPHQMCGECLSQLKGYSEFLQAVLQADKVLRLKFIGSETTDQSPKTVTTNFSHNVKFESDEADTTTIEFMDMQPGVSSPEISPEGTLKCRFCQVPLIDPDMSIQHSVEVHNHQSGLSICVLCELGFTSLDLLKEHVQAKHHKQFESRLRKFQCIVCLRRYTTQTQLQKHTCTKGTIDQVSLHCEICNQAFPTKIRLNFHRQFHLKNARPLFCTHCRITFKNENEYFDHVNFLHDPKQIFVCDICEKTFNLRSALNNHKKMHIGERNHKCEVCHKSFLNKQTLQEHEVCHMETKPYQCHLCGKKLNRMSRLRKHLLTHESDPVVNNVHICMICKECLGNEELADIHREEEHSEEINCIEIVSTDKVFRCEYCEKCFSTPEALNIHRSEHTGLTPYSCHICKAQFTSYSRCTTHKTTHGIFKDGAEKDSFPVIKHFLCEHCGKSYLHWSYLSLHRRLKHLENTQTYKCPDCYMEFLNTWGLNYHRKTKHQSEPIKCQDCGKYLANLKSLQIHLVTQHADKKEKEFKCEKCGKIFAYQVSLEAHLKTHIKEFKCTKCPKSFVHSTGLANHLKLHKEPRNACSYCGKKFTSKTECDEHELLHKKRKFNCDICDKIFDSKTHLMEHNKIHTNTPYVCDVCGLAFRRPFSLKSHMNRHIKSKSTGSFILMVDMKEEQQEAQEKAQNAISLPDTTILDNSLTPENAYIQLGLDNAPSENYIDIGNGNYLKVQGNTVNIDGKDYILIDQNGKAVDKNQQFQMIVDENYTENQIPVLDNLDSTVMLVEGENQIILNENQVEPEYVFTTDNAVSKANTTYVIGNQYILGADDQVTF